MYVLLYYVGVGAMFQVFVDAKLVCEKEVKKREETKKKGRKEENAENYKFWACGVRHAPCHVILEFKYHGIRHGLVAFATDTQCCFFSNCTEHGQGPSLFPLHHYNMNLGKFNLTSLI